MSIVKMDADSLINLAIQNGERYGLESLAGTQRFIFAVSEEEAYCDMEGIEGLLHRYGVQGMHAFAQAYAAVGASEIAEILSKVACTAACARSDACACQSAYYRTLGLFI